MIEMSDEAFEARAGFEAGKQDLVGDDDRKAGEGDGEGAVVEERDAEQRRAEEKELNRNADEFERRAIQAARGGDGREQPRSRYERRRRSADFKALGDVAPALR